MPKHETVPLGIVSGIVSMAKALLLDRPSGTFARFLVPQDLRASVGRRYLVRRLPPSDRDRSRLIGACMRYALGKAFLKLRKDPVSDPKKLIDDVLKAAQEGRVQEYIIQGPNGFMLKVDDAADHARAMEALPVILESLAPASASTNASPAQSAPAKAAPMLHASIALFLTQFAEKNPAAATLLETRHSVELFRDLTRDKPLAEVGVEECDAFRAALSLWPARARVLPDYKGLTPRAIIAKAKKLKPPGLNVRTKEKHLDRLRVFFNWAVQRRWMSTNPLTGVRLQSKAQKYAPKRRGFTRDELKRLFDPALRREHCLTEPSKFWLPLLAIYTGARLRELAQLRVVDVRQIANVWGIDITADAGSLKNAASQRFVPLPDAIFNAGLLDYVQALTERSFDRLFPDGSWDAKNGPGDRTSGRALLPGAIATIEHRTRIKRHRFGL
ncbi:hypothetical protein [Dyella sp. 333MFSha]|uniref:hypothetical protein n=1 Tax=Dyella sp. 333MFSha TaxID=1798240 RepID=UPI00087EE108|nr:hypothetical protein [Dyella sp. 333MFSha]SDG02712.1 hypothetical protein SAMN04515659_1923 [Dyella sp. 333MFSha]